ncbi:DNA polymerase III subunit epsilon [Methylosinus sp. RM1]|jgi:hypothetical protein|uniref:DNA polymerase III subunit epsilon n=1 Tax=Methylosinus sp. RM1 TaxID=2583817 RepID=UPI00140DC7D9|nr:DNA polymerase III subunit epsilon [Methylosinus sp. RM1]
MSSTIYFVTDVELDGPDPSRNSMISFASAALDADSGVVGTFEVNVAPLAGRSPDPHTAAWWATQPLAYEASTRDPRAAEEAMIAFADWVESFAAVRVFASRPLMLDGVWIDEYLRRFAGARVFSAPWEGRQLFHGAGLDIGSLLIGLFGWSYAQAHDVSFPKDWLGGHAHTHRAIDDALGYANVLHCALRVSAAQPKKHEDFRNVPA